MNPCHARHPWPENIPTSAEDQSQLGEHGAGMPGEPAGWKPALRAPGLTPGIGARSFRPRHGHLGMRSGVGSDGSAFLVADVWCLRGGRRLLDLRNLAGKQELL